MADNKTVRLVCTVLAENVGHIIQALTSTGLAENISVAPAAFEPADDPAEQLVEAIADRRKNGAAILDETERAKRKPRAPRAGVSRTVYMLTKHATPERIKKASLNPSQRRVLDAIVKATKTREKGLRGGFHRIGAAIGMNENTVDGSIYGLRTMQPPLVVSKTVDPA